MKRSEALVEVDRILHGPRSKDYGPIEDNFGRIATGWAVIFGHEVTPRQVALAMDWVKTARLINNPDHEDGWLDKIGYSAIGSELKR